jgi:predicted transcriptional regulator
MAKTNITLKIDTELLKKIKVLAAQQDTSISALLIASLEEKLRKDLDFEHAKQKALARLEKGYDLGFQPVRSRDELHER